MSGIHEQAYKGLIAALGFSGLEVEVYDHIQQLARPHEEILEKLEVDVRAVKAGNPDDFTLKITDHGEYTQFIDEWGVTWRKPKQGGFYYDMVAHPLEEVIEVAALEDYPFIDPLQEGRHRSLQETARTYSEASYGVTHFSLGAGISEMHAWLRGYENYYTDFYFQPEIALYIMERITEIKIAYWEKALALSGEYVDVIVEADDLAGQNGPLISVEMYREFIKPFHARLFKAVKRFAPHVKIFLHSCGAVRSFIPDFIETGIDILNPVQKSAAGMDLAALKQEFGSELVFWGGGVDTQQVFDRGSVEDVRQDVGESIAALKPGGGFVFTPVHNTQPTVQPENYLAMWETLKINWRY
jgi:uroporphyrinogen decarboxylase